MAEQSVSMYTSSLADRAGMVDDNPHMLSIPLALVICCRSTKHTQHMDTGNAHNEGKIRRADEIKGCHT